MAEAVFWTFILLILYVYLGYPAAIFALSRLFPRPDRKGGDAPELTVLVVAHNEERHMAEKIRNLVGLDYPKRPVRIVVASDASSDRTDDIVRSFGKEGVRLVRFESRIGKAAILNRLIPRLETEIVVLSDSRQTWNPGALLFLASRFEDPSVGAVSGELVLKGGDGGFGEGVGFYWKYEKFLRKCEAAFDSTCGLTGCIYAMRRSLFVPFPDDTLLDDFVIPMNIVRSGKRVVFEERAEAYDVASETPAQEKKRKIRTLSGNYQAFFRMGWLFNPFSNRLAFQFVSHKTLRLAVPYLMVGAFLSNALLLQSPPYRLLFAVQVAVYALFLLSFTVRNRLTNVVKAFVVLNWVAFLALPVYLSGRQKAAWK